jgi:hypothetical protein
VSLIKLIAHQGEEPISVNKVSSRKVDKSYTVQLYK